MAQSAVIPAAPAGYDDIPSAPDGYDDVPQAPEGYEDAPTATESPSLGQYARLLPAGIARAAGTAISGVARLAQYTPAGIVGKLMEREGLPTATELGTEIADRAMGDYGVQQATRETIPGKIIEGIGSVVPVLASGPAALAVGGAMAGEGALQEAAAAGASESDQAKAYVFNAITGALTEKLLGVPALLKSAKKVASPVLESIGKQIATQVAKGFGREGLQETLQQFAQDVIAKHVVAYDPERNLFDPKKLGETFLVGGIAGGALGGVTQAAASVDARLQARAEALTTAPQAPTSPAPEQTATQPATAPEEEAGLAEVQPQPTNRISELENKLDQLLVSHKAETDPVKQSALWDEARKLQSDIIAEETAANEPETQLAAIASEEPPPVTPLNPPEVAPTPSTETTAPAVVAPEAAPVAQTPPLTVETATGAGTISPVQEATLQPEQQVPETGAISQETFPESVVEKSNAEPEATPPPLPTDGKRVTSTKNAVTDAEIAARGGEPLKSGQHVTDETTWKAAEVELQTDPDKGSKLVAELNAKPRPITNVENDVLLRHKIAVHNRGRALMETIADPATFDSDRAFAISQLAENDAAVDSIDTALRSGGTETGRALAARRKMADEDFSLVAMRARTRAAQNGEPLSAEQEAEIADLHKQLTAAQERIAELTDAKAKAEAEDTLESLKKEVSPRRATTPAARSRILDKLKEGHDQALKNIRSRMGRTSAGVDPTILADVVRIGAYHIANGATKLADFTAKMVQELGEWVRKDIKNIWKSAKEDHASIVSEEMAQEKPNSRENVLAKFSEEGAELTQKNVFDLARHHVNEGVTELADVMEAVRKDLAEAFPGITVREIRDLFSGYGKVRYSSKEADLVKLRELRRLGQLASAIEDARSKVPPKKSGQQRDEPTQAIRDAMKELQAAMREAGIETTSPEQQLASANKARATALRNQIEDLDRQLQTGEKPVRGQPVPDSLEVEALRSERDAMKAELARIEAEANPKRSPDEILLTNYKRSIKRSTERMKSRIASGDYSPRKNRTYKADDELTAALAEREAVRQKYLEGQLAAKLAQRGNVTKAFDFIGEVLGLLRAIKTSYDISAPLRQNKRAVTSMPSLLKNLGPQMRAMFSQKAAYEIAKEIESRRNSKNGTYKKMGLSFTDVNATTLTKMEEDFQSRWAKHVPGVAGSQRAFSTFSNKTRADMADTLLDLWFPMGATDAELKALGNVVNNFTGRGTLGKHETAGPLLNRIFFAPKFVMSHVQFLAGQPFYGGSKQTRKMVASLYGRYIAGTAVYATLMALMQDDKDPRIGLDPRKKDTFMTVRVGNTRYDLLSGLKQVIGLATSLGSAALGDEKERRNIGGTTGRFLRSKLAPGASSAYTFASGKTFIGNDVRYLPRSVDDWLTGGGELAQMMTPMSIPMIYEAMKSEGLTKNSLVASILGVLGEGVNTYDERTPKEKNPFKEDKYNEQFNLRLRQKMGEWEILNSQRMQKLEKDKQDAERQKAVERNRNQLTTALVREGGSLKNPKQIKKALPALKVRP